MNEEEKACQGRKFFYLREPRINREDLPPSDNEPENKGEEGASKEAKVSRPGGGLLEDEEIIIQCVFSQEGNTKDLNKIWL